MSGPVRPGPFLPPTLPGPTARLRFRWYREDEDEDEVARVLAMFADPQARSVYPDMQDEATVRAVLAKARVRRERDGVTFMPLERLEDGAFVGDCGLLVQEVEPLGDAAADVALASGAPIGTVSPDPADHAAHATGPDVAAPLAFVEVGYRLHADHRGRGYATEAARAARDHAFDVLGVPWVGSLVLPTNEPSLRVAARVHARTGDVRFHGRHHRLFWTARTDDRSESG